MKLYIPYPAKSAVSGSNAWNLPIGRCPACGRTLADLDLCYPQLNLPSGVPERPYKKEGVVSVQHLQELRVPLTGLLDERLPLYPGLKFGPFKGTIYSRTDFAWPWPWQMLARREVLDKLSSHLGAPLLAVPAILSGGGKGKPEYSEVVALPSAVLSQRLREELCITECPVCVCEMKTYRVPEPFRLSFSFVPGDAHLFRTAEIAHKLICTEQFKQAVEEFGFGNIAFESIEVIQIESVGPGPSGIPKRPSANAPVVLSTESRPRRKQAPFPFAAWADRLRQYVNSKEAPADLTPPHVLPPLSHTELETLTQQLDVGIPPSVRDFLLQASSGCRFPYKVNDVFQGETTGSFRFCEASLFPGHLQECQAWARDTWIADEPDERKIWLKSFPIAAIGNGDYIAVRSKEVLYLSHDDSSYMLARDLGTFLIAWAKLGYVYPSGHGLELLIEQIAKVGS